MYILENLEPKKVFKFFEEISLIPRGSGNERAIADYLVEFATQRNLWVNKDNNNNVIIKKPATKGYENSKTVILQGHTDMVTEKNSDTIHDFKKDPIQLYIDGDFVKARGTTLGADNGIAVAMALAFLDSNEYKHPNIEALFTSEEETGMFGALAVNEQLLNGKILLNIDSEEEGIFLASCAGGIRQCIELPINYVDVKKDSISYEIMIKGLCGGHSGQDIDKELANSNVLMGRVLSEIDDIIDVNIISIEGGAKDNAIPRECTCKISIEEKDEDKFLSIINECSNVFKNEFRVNEPNLELCVEKSSIVQKCFDTDTTKKVIATILLIPNGVKAMSLDIKGLVETSNNLGVIKIKDDVVKFNCATRSSVLTRKKMLISEMKILANLVKAKHSVSGDYPAWEYKEESFVRDVFVKTYKDMYGKTPKVDAIHAGLECGLLIEKMPYLDMISFGPNISGAHTPEEKLSISSTKRVWEFLLNVLENLK